MTDKPLVSAEEMASVLSGSVEREGGPIVEKPTSDRYSLRRPLVISMEREEAATQRLGQLATRMAKALSTVLATEIEIEVHGFQQQHVRAALDRLSGPPWVLYFTGEEGGGIALGLDPPSGLALVELSLGGAGTLTAAGRGPTPLENRVMLNLTSELRKLLSDCGGPTLVGSAFRLESVGPDFGSPGEMVGAGLLRIRLGGSERTGLLLATPDLLVDREDEEAEPGDDSQGPLMEMLLRVPLQMRPVLRGGELALADLMCLKQGNVLRLDAEQDEALWLTVRGVPLLRGRIQRQDGKAVLSIVDRSGKNTETQGVHDG